MSKITAPTFSEYKTWSSYMRVLNVYIKCSSVPFDKALATIIYESFQGANRNRAIHRMDEAEAKYESSGALPPRITEHEKRHKVLEERVRLMEKDYVKSDAAALMELEDKLMELKEAVLVLLRPQ